jgi:Txe/YoeB family toxin of Txe-Axe toxin-antitoxin module
VKVRLNFTPRAAKDLQEFARDAGQRKRLRSVRKALALLETNQRHPSLHTHKYESLKGPRGEEVFEAYAENRTPAYRIFWLYGPGNDEITIIAITPHPQPG